MVHQLREVGLDFIGTAPVRLVFAQQMSAPPEAVHRALAEDVPGWEEWFSAVTLARSTGDGSTREIHLKGGGRFRETVLAAKAPELYAYRVDVANAPGARAIAEEWRLTPAGAGTRVRWTFAVDGTAAFRVVAKLGRAGLGRAFRDAVRTLDRRLATQGS
ncbi:SRPBCC family protein [Streptomyces canus]|uniref:Carbon monoxide dehydrogenase subunit G n=1 Tax=Streptomyces canus TaxID=58343 RepID=A0AAW8FRU4_9ACTN|nr:SRPBCC family protein [Streptomyces canus]MDQ0758384.1 carbon monoxide dehydrogenase subunit G [Streptomyces canus]MDQ0912872.1 carbon monoxide dehydrogenase subunit G [Streptomyces canus]MDQ1072860.1 carbon monoxide dehydrogenase subunit G [Streptomyces canus]